MAWRILWCITCSVLSTGTDCSMPTGPTIACRCCELLSSWRSKASHAHVEPQSQTGKGTAHDGDPPAAAQDTYTGTSQFVATSAPPFVATNVAMHGSLQQTQRSTDATALPAAGDGAGHQVQSSGLTGGTTDEAALSSSTGKSRRQSLLHALDACVDAQILFAGRYVFVPEAAKHGAQAVVHFARRCATLIVQLAYLA
jgi:hypothetical protein